MIRKLASVASFVISITMIVVSAVIAIQEREVHCLQTMEAYLVVVSLLSLLSSTLLLYHTFAYRPILYRIGLYLTFLFSVAFVAVLVMRSQAMMKPKQEWSQTAVCLSARRFCDHKPYSLAMEKGCCHKPSNCTVGQLIPSPECGLWQVDDPAQLCYYCPECKRAVKSFLSYRSRSLTTVVVSVLGIVFLVVVGFHCYEDLRGKNPLRATRAAAETAVTAAATAATAAV